VVRVSLLGGFAVRVGERPVEFPRRAAGALVACLALRGGAPVRRDALAEALWPETAPAASRNRFDVALHAARHALEPEVPARGPFRLLVTDGGLCRLGPAGLDTDLERFERAARECEALLPRTGTARPPARGGDAARALARIGAALAIYRGDLLPALPDLSWAAAERDRLRDRHHRLLLGYGALALDAGRTGEAADAARRILDEDPLHEEALRVIMRALAAGGERAAALRACQEFERRLAAELDTTPGPETVALRRELAGSGG
jgi:DNA-binding SARP family transcriptional activator